MRGLPRKALINYKPTTRGVSLSALAGMSHYHFCKDRDCRLIYEDSCDTPGTNEHCQFHRGIRRALITVRDPQECCVGNCTQVIDKAQLVLYRLAGPGPWYQCSQCFLSHGWPCT